MIGVMTDARRRAAASEFFELFKTCWEFYRSGARYDAVICCGVPIVRDGTPLVVIYTTEEGEGNVHLRAEVSADGSRAVIKYKGGEVPLYSRNLPANRKSSFSGRPRATAEVDQGSGKEKKILRVDYDLFAEVEYLLTTGQPREYSDSPSLERHIEILRQVLQQNQVVFPEIPAVPAGYNFIACLTHDVDHFAIRNHRFDHTAIGFIYRATIGSLFDLCRGRKSVRQLLRNVAAVVSLPFVHLGLAKDFWTKLERYLDIDGSSTFFVIPKAGDAGVGLNTKVDRKRAASYFLAQLEPALRRIVERGGEVALHGIDAWQDSAEGRRERQEIGDVTGKDQLGVRMHWLYFDQSSPIKLEEAGFDYDSTFGYNETVGYRAGTTQAFKPLGCEKLLELPLHIMDTALFYPANMNLSPRDAITRCELLVEEAKQLGGALVINWHDRSIEPERLWDNVYYKLVNQLKKSGAWICTAQDAVRWFRLRRSAKFAGENGNDVVLPSEGTYPELPGLMVRREHSAPLRFPPTVREEPVLSRRSVAAGPKKALASL